jgi:hypothetical protein
VSLQAEEIEEVRIPKNEVGRQRIILAQFGQLLSHQFFGFLGDGCSFEQHTPDLVSQRADAPTFEAAHFGVEIAGKVVVSTAPRQFWDRQIN